MMERVRLECLQGPRDESSTGVCTRYMIPSENRGEPLSRALRAQEESILPAWAPWPGACSAERVIKHRGPQKESDLGGKLIQEGQEGIHGRGQ